MLGKLSDKIAQLKGNGKKTNTTPSKIYPLWFIRFYL
jgi:hypothetical protein